jgi:hypothetical protein
MEPIDTAKIKPSKTEPVKTLGHQRPGSAPAKGPPQV